MIGDSWDHRIVNALAETCVDMLDPELPERERRRPPAMCRCPYHDQKFMASNSDILASFGQSPRRSFGPGEGPTIMNSDRVGQPSPELSCIDPEQLTNVRRSVSSQPDGTPEATPAYYLFVKPSDPRKPPRAIPVFPGDCIAVVILVDYLMNNS